MALYLIIQIGAALSRIIPRPWRYRCGTAVGDCVYWTWGAKRRILRNNMAQVLGLPPDHPSVHAVALQSMRNYCKYLIEFLELPVLSSSDPVIAGMRIEGLEHLQGALAAGRGVIMASGHFGTIELGGVRLSDFTSFYAVYDSFRPAYLDRLIQRKRLDKGIHLIPVQNVRQMLRVLREANTLVMLFDRPVDRNVGVPVQFFGRPTAVPAGPAVLALKTGAALVPVYMEREADNTFTARILPAVGYTTVGDRDRDARMIMQRLMDTYQAAIMRRPDLWYMFRPMWPEREALAADSRAADGPAA